MLCAVHRRKEHKTEAHGLPDCAPLAFFIDFLFGLFGITALMRVRFLPRRCDCRADAVALGAWERWHRRETVTERAFKEQTLRPSSRSELVEFARSANFRVWELRTCIVLRGRRHGGAAQAAAPLCGSPWPSNLLFLILFSGSDSFAAHISRNSQRLRLSNR